MARTRPWELSDEAWERAGPLLPMHKLRVKGGRPPEDDRRMLAAILYVLRTGIQWNALPREIGASTTVYDRFRWWLEDGVFLRLWQAGLAEFDDLEGLDWSWLSLDGAMTKAPFGGAATGPNPTDRGKKGTKRSQLSEGHGLPIAVAVAGANRPDMRLVAETLDGIVVERPEPSEEDPQHLLLDAGYDYQAVSARTSRRAATPPTSAPGAKTAPTPARWTRPRSPAAGWWNACIPGSTALAACSSAGRSAPTPTKPSSTSPAPSSASVTATGSSPHGFPNKL